MKATTYRNATNNGHYAVLKTKNGKFLGRGKTAHDALMDVLNTYELFLNNPF